MKVIPINLRELIEVVHYRNEEHIESDDHLDYLIRRAKSELGDEVTKHFNIKTETISYSDNRRIPNTRLTGQVYFITEENIKILQKVLKQITDGTYQYIMLNEEKEYDRMWEGKQE